MTQREITIGRDNSCDIRLDNGCMYASRFHGCIYHDGNVLMYRDQSSNGTLINNVSVRNRAILINPGDSIMIAGRYPVSWNIIERYFPEQHEEPIKEPTILYKFNWGAFFLYPIWGFWNGCWWAFFLNLFLWWSVIILPIIFGIYGSRWSWEYRKWSSVEAFENAQRSWTEWGIAIFLVGIFFSLFMYMMFFSLICSFL